MILKYLFLKELQASLAVPWKKWISVFPEIFKVRNLSKIAKLLLFLKLKNSHGAICVVLSCQRVGNYVRVAHLQSEVGTKDVLEFRTLFMKNAPKVSSFSFGLYLAGLKKSPRIPAKSSRPPPPPPPYMREVGTICQTGVFSAFFGPRTGHFRRFRTTKIATLWETVFGDIHWKRSAKSPKMTLFGPKTRTVSPPTLPHDLAAKKSRKIHRRASAGVQGKNGRETGKPCFSKRALVTPWLFSCYFLGFSSK